MIRLTINNRSVEVAEGRTLLEACREHGIHVPTLCYHPALEAYGACRLCVVEMSQPRQAPRLVAACTHPCEEGAIVETHSEAARRSRRLTAELLVGANPAPEIAALAEELGVTQVRYTLPAGNACMLCGLCVRACREIVGVSAISLIRRGVAKKVSPPFEIASAACIGCGTCVLICPTGAIRLSDVTGFRGVHPVESEYYREHCQVCGDADLDPHFVEDVAALLTVSRDEG
jgi:NADH dehydrogenase/NADH:ubiquinone oxidoreductase subunit G